MASNKVPFPVFNFKPKRKVQIYIQVSNETVRAFPSRDLRDTMSLK